MPHLVEPMLRPTSSASFKAADLLMRGNVSGGDWMIQPLSICVTDSSDLAIADPLRYRTELGDFCSFTGFVPLAITGHDRGVYMYIFLRYTGHAEGCYV